MSNNRMKFACSAAAACSPNGCPCKPEGMVGDIYEALDRQEVGTVGVGPGKEHLVGLSSCTMVAVGRRLVYRKRFEILVPQSR